MADTIAIPFTQFVSPNGRTTQVSINRPAEIGVKAMEILARGWRFECEILSDGKVSLTVTDDERDADIEVVTNGPDVPLAVDRLVERFFESGERSHYDTGDEETVYSDNSGEDAGYRSSMKDAGRGHLLR